MTCGNAGVERMTVDLDAKIQLIKDRFIHRTDAYAEQWHNPERGTGYAKKKRNICVDDPCQDPDCTHVGPRPLTTAVIKKHLAQEITIGVYQLAQDDTVKWLCFDVDITKGVSMSEQEATAAVRAETLALATFLTSKNIPYLVEQSGSRGYHIWIFFSEPVDARSAYALGHWAALQAPPPDGVSIEVFPKQIAVGAYGNLVKLPLSLHRKTMNPCVFVGADWKPKADQWTTLANVRLISKKNLHAFLANNTIDIPERPTQENTESAVGVTTPPCMARMMTEGLGEGRIDIGLFKLSCYLRDRGLTEPMAQSALEAMLHQTKAPNWAVALLQQKISSAYSRRYSPLPCSEPLLDQYCSSSCRFFDGKVRQRLGANADAAKARGKISRD